MENITLDFQVSRASEARGRKTFAQITGTQRFPKRVSGEMICQKRFPRLSSRCGRVADSHLRGSLPSERSKGPEEPCSSFPRHLEARVTQTLPHPRGPRWSQSLGWDGKRKPKDLDVSPAGQKRGCAFVPHRLSVHYPRCLGQAVCQSSS